MKNIIFLILTFIINLIQLIFIFVVPWGGFYLFKHFSFPFTAVLDKPEISGLSDMSISLINYLIFFLYFGGVLCGLIVPFLSRIKLKKRLTMNILITLIPILILGSLWILYPSPDTSTRYNSEGYRWEKYEWNTKEGIRTKLWRSEKCDTCYEANQRIKWVLKQKTITQ